MSATDQFSRQTLVEAVTLLEEWDISKIERLILRFELEDKISYKELNRPQLANHIILHLIHLNGEDPQKNQEYIYQFIEQIASEIKEPKGDIPAFMGNQLFRDPAERLKNCLSRDGYKLENGKLKNVIPKVSSPGKKTSELEELLSEKGFNEALKLFHNALSAHTTGNWQEANSSITQFLDEVGNRSYRNDPFFNNISDQFLNKELPNNEKESTFRIQIAVLTAERHLS